MSTTTDRQLAAILAATAEGGCTFEAANLIIFAPKDGYAVGIGGVKYPANLFDADTLRWTAHAVAGEYETAFVGTWLDDNGTVCIDAVKYFAAMNRADALACGRYYGQQAVFDFAAGESIYLDEVGL